MGELHRVGDLEIDEDLAFQRRDWKVQRAGWILMAAIILATLGGLFGRGALSAVVEGGANDPLRIERNRFLRRHADERMMLLVAPSAVDASGEVRISLDSALIEGISIRQFVPEPEQQTATADGIVATFRFDAASAPSPALPRRVRIDYQADAYWSVRGAIGLSERAPLRFHSIVFP